MFLFMLPQLCADILKYIFNLQSLLSFFVLVLAGFLEHE